jgi:hypothetical protein
MNLYQVCALCQKVHYDHAENNIRSICRDGHLNHFACGRTVLELDKEELAGG